MGLIVDTEEKVSESDDKSTEIHYTRNWNPKAMVSKEIMASNLQM